MKYVVIGIIAVGIVIGIYFVFFHSNIEVHDIQKFEYSDYDGQTSHGDVVYKIYYKKNKLFASYKPYGEESVQEVEIEGDVLSQLETILNHYHVVKWDGFHGNNKDVLDGNSFSLMIQYGNDKKIEATGYMKYPNDYQKVVKEIKILFLEIFHENRRG